MKRALVYVLVVATVIFGCAFGLALLAPDGPGPRPRPHQSQADQAWEGLTGRQQQMLTATRETGEHLDELVISFRKVTLDNPGLDPWVEKDSDGLWSIYSR